VGLEAKCKVSCYNDKMEITTEMYEKIKDCFPKHRKPCKISNLGVLNAVIYMLENSCSWRSLPEKFGNWHVIYERISCWNKKKVLEEAFLKLQRLGIIALDVRVLFLDSTSCKVHPDANGALEKTENNRSENQEEGGIQKFIWSPHLPEIQ
jgi:transposase